MEEAHRAPKPPTQAQLSSNWRVKDNTPRPTSSSPQNPIDSHRRKRNDQQPPSATTRLYVGNLLYTTQREQVESLFQENGFQISGMTMSIDPFTGRNPSYAFVDFDTQEEADKAAETLNGADLLGRPVKIRPNVEKRGGGTFQSRVRNYNQDWGKRQELGQVNNYKPTFDRASRNDAPSHFTAPVAEGRRLWVGNIPRIEPQAAVDAEMQQFFSGFELTAVSKIINPLRQQPDRASEKVNHYFCFVDFATRDEADRAALELDNAAGSWGGQVKVKKARDNPNRKVIREQQLLLTTEQQITPPTNEAVAE